MKTKKWLIGCVMVLACACASGIIYADTNFHYPHVKIWDFARAQEYIADPVQRGQVYDFLAAHVDVVESSEDSSKSLALKQRNPNIRTFTYQLDISQCQHQGCYANAAVTPDPPGATEAMYLHFAETTRYTLHCNHNGQDVIMTVPGCSDPNHPTKASRVRTYMWLDFRWVYNQKSTAFRTLMAKRLIAASDAAAADGIFLDEHGPGVAGSIGWNPANVISGGRLFQYPGKRFEQTDSEANADLAASLAYYNQELNKHGKFLVINGAVWSAGDPLVIAQIKAAGGTVTEFLVRPTVGDGGGNFENMLKGLDESIAAGAMIDLYGNLNYQDEIDGLATWTPGNYSSKVGRWHMWRLAYYLPYPRNGGLPGRSILFS